MLLRYRHERCADQKRNENNTASGHNLSLQLARSGHSSQREYLSEINFPRTIRTQNGCELSALNISHGSADAVDAFKTDR